MTISFHPDEATLMSYAAGALTEPFAIIVGSHAELCPACRRTLRMLNALGGALMAEAPEARVDESAIDRLLSRLEAAPPAAETGGRTPSLPNAADLPGPLARLVGGGVDQVKWRLVLPGADDCRFTFSGHRGEHTLRFLRAGPGMAIPEHTHVGTELTMVLRGRLRDGDRVYAAGDVGDLDNSAPHTPTVEGEEICICVIAEEGPPYFTSEEMRELQKQIGI
jgi:putative transcriptional regulator